MRKAVWIPIAIAAMIIVAYATTNLYRVPTLEVVFAKERPARVATAVLTVSGLKCRGTSALCAQQIQEIPGLVAMTTYARTHTAVIEYDPTMTNVAALRDAICRPVVSGGKSYDVFRVVGEKTRD
jgi:hypothetical protein